MLDFLKCQFTQKRKDELSLNAADIAMNNVKMYSSELWNVALCLTPYNIIIHYSLCHMSLNWDNVAMHQHHYAVHGNARKQRQAVVWSTKGHLHFIKPERRMEQATQ